MVMDNMSKTAFRLDPNRGFKLYGVHGIQDSWSSNYNFSSFKVKSEITNKSGMSKYNGYMPTHPIKWSYTRFHLIRDLIGIDWKSVWLSGFLSTKCEDLSDKEFLPHYLQLVISCYNMGLQGINCRFIDRFISLTAKGPDGNVEFKRWRQATIFKSIESFKVYQREQKLATENIKYNIINSYDEFPCEQFCVWWETETFDLEEVSNIPVKIDKKILKRYKKCLRRILRSHITDVEDVSIDDVVSNTKSSKSYVWDYSNDLPKQKKFIYEIKNFDESKINRFRGVRCKVNVGPCNVRDTVILSIESSTCIRKYSRILAQILKPFKGSCIGDSFESAQAKLEHFRTKCVSYYMRDFKKCGLTMPRELLIETIDILSEVYPSINWEPYSQLWKDYVIYDNGVRLRPARGHSLGMANELTTLIQLVINELNWRYNSQLIGGETDFLTLNDDMVVGIRRQLDHVDQEWINADINTCSKLGLIVSPWKCAISNHSFVFLENYLFRNRFSRKALLYNFALLRSLLCHNIVEAKLRVSALPADKLDTCLLEDLLIKEFGYEFFDYEHELPATLGGWLRTKKGGLNDDLVHLFDMNRYYDEKVCNAYSACSDLNLLKVKIRYIKGRVKKNKIYYPPCRHGLLRNYFSEEVLARSGVGIIKYQSDWILSQPNSKLKFRFWETLRRERRREYHRPSRDLFQILNKNLKNGNYYPPRTWCKGFQTGFDIIENKFLSLNQDIMIPKSTYHKCIFWEGNINRKGDKLPLPIDFDDFLKREPEKFPIRNKKELLLEATQDRGRSDEVPTKLFLCDTPENLYSLCVNVHKFYNSYWKEYGQIPIKIQPHPRILLEKKQLRLFESPDLDLTQDLWILWSTNNIAELCDLSIEIAIRHRENLYKESKYIILNDFLKRRQELRKSSKPKHINLEKEETSREDQFIYNKMIFNVKFNRDWVERTNSIETSIVEWVEINYPHNDEMFEWASKLSTLSLFIGTGPSTLGRGQLNPKKSARDKELICRLRNLCPEVLKDRIFEYLDRIENPASVEGAGNLFDTGDDGY